MSLIEKALRQLETDKKKGGARPEAGLCTPEEGNLLYKNRFLFLFIVLSGISIAIVTSFVVCKTFSEENTETRRFPVIKPVQLIKTSAKTNETNFPILLQNAPSFTKTVSANKTATHTSHETQGDSPLPEVNPSKVHEPRGHASGSSRLVNIPQAKLPPQEKDRLRSSEQRPEKFYSGIYLSPDALNNAGLLYLEKGDLKQARIFFEEAMKYSPNNETFINNMGLSFYLEGEKQEAIKYFNSALKINPKNIETFGNLGIVYRKSGQYTMSENMFKKALLINPGHPEILYNYALLLEDINQKKISRLYFEKFLRVAPESLKELREKVRNHLQSASVKLEVQD